VERRFAWRWVTTPDTPEAGAAQTLLTEWRVEAGADGGSVVHLHETGFDGRHDWDVNRIGWSDDLFPRIRALVDVVD
jgi:hypothetical protein